MTRSAYATVARECAPGVKRGKTVDTKEDAVSYLDASRPYPQRSDLANWAQVSRDDPTSMGNEMSCACDRRQKVTAVVLTWETDLDAPDRRVRESKSQAHSSQPQLKLLMEERAFGWCFPGGKVMTGETWKEAGVREMWEETGVTVMRLKRVPHNRTHTQHNVRTYLATRWSVRGANGGIPRAAGVTGLEGQHVAWVPIAEVTKMRLSASASAAMPGVRRMLGVAM